MTDKEIVLALRIHNDKTISDCSNCPLSSCNCCYETLINNAIDCIEFYATDRPRGKWISQGTGGYFNPGKHCSLCGKVVEFSENYCPNCGAKMEIEP